MAHDNGDDIPSWAVQDIVYVSVLGPFIVAAFLEWFLWLAAFLYCLGKVFVKADHWSIKVLAVIMMLMFTGFRGAFLPVMVVTLPLPPNITRHFPVQVVSFLQWFAFWTFAILLIIPWLFCIYRLVTNSVGRTKRIKEVLDERTAPKTVIVMPVYKEAPDILIKAVDSVVDCDYPPSCIHVFLSYDGGQVDESYLTVAAHLGVPITLKCYPESIDVSYKGARITISRFKHGGKRHCQKLTFKLIDKIYAKYLQRNDNLFVLFIDSDCILDRVCLQNFMYDMELKPGSKRNMLAMTGVITSTTQKNTLITLLQDLEYIHGQLFERSVESGCGSVTCLPGALTILRFSAFRKMAKYYFADKAEQCEDLFDFGKCHLGEDRWLTHLFMIGAKERYQIQMCTSAFCKTEAVQTFRGLLKQRRRWFLGFITNEVCMLTDIRLWYRYPMLCLVRFMQNTIRTTALLFFIMVISVITTSNKVENLPVGFIAVSLGLNYLLMLYFGAKLRRYKAWLYPLMFILNPFFNWLYMVYGIFTAGQRTWGGPRADAAAADENTTPEEAAVRAKATGDELNIKLDTFRAVAEGKSSVPIHPAEGVEGRFAAPDLQPNGYYYTENDDTSTMTFPEFLPRNPAVSPLPLHPRVSFDSDWTNGSNSMIHLPRTIESIMGDEDQRKVHLARRSRACSSIGVEVGEFDDGIDSSWGVESMSDSGGRSISRGKSPARSSTRSERISSSATGAFVYDGANNGGGGSWVPPDTGVFEPTRSRRAGRSPLGRNSPVRAVEVDGMDDSPSPSLSPSPERAGGAEGAVAGAGAGSVHHQDNTQDEKGVEQAESSATKSRRKQSRLVKRSRDPGDIV
ncbi:chitin synthase [Blastomyces dermatitidis ER-3]|uniref:chitin synthase n=2 Tax=Ajellomyces dermatitidis TaxID=5039 RepID=F2TEW4_AJEDA|nr:chitin synthase [Blastomyces dermatitidis ER-3]EEQ88844.1 chitin synthase [Blastomyces dermatitidis ER-3]EGE81749.1 chitin synthase [Blastomyces dermatitidis ATCC 18188]EQL28233.1 chitin synthase [Blastomyces dermatitidis ATCC 26199]